MHTDTLASNWDTLLLGLPMIVLLFFGFFRLDEVFTAHKPRKGMSRKVSPLSRRRDDGMCTDPDGRPWDL